MNGRSSPELICAILPTFRGAPRQGGGEVVPVPGAGGEAQVPEHKWKLALSLGGLATCGTVMNP